MKQLALLCFGVLALSAADLVPVAGPRTEPFFVDPYFEEGSGISIASSRNSNVSLVPGGLRLGTIEATLNFKGSNSAVVTTWGEPLPAQIREYPGNRIKRRYRGVQQSTVYPGIDMEFFFNEQAQLIWRMKCDSNCDWSKVQIEAPGIIQTNISGNSLEMRFGFGRIEPRIIFPNIKGGAFRVDGQNIFGIDAAGSRNVEIVLNQSERRFGPGPMHLKDAAGNEYVGFNPFDDLGTPAPYPAERYRGCYQGIGTPGACTDVAIAKFSKSGELLYITQLIGARADQWITLKQAPDGQLILGGATSSRDFPTTPGAFQTRFAGPEPAAMPSSSNRWMATSGLPGYRHVNGVNIPGRPGK